MNIQESDRLNQFLRWLFTGAGHETDARDALAWLTDRASSALTTSMTGTTVAACWSRIAAGRGQPPAATGAILELLERGIAAAADPENIMAYAGGSIGYGFAISLRSTVVVARLTVPPGGTFLAYQMFGSTIERMSRVYVDASALWRAAALTYHAYSEAHARDVLRELDTGTEGAS